MEKSFLALAVVMDEFSFLQISLLGSHNIKTLTFMGNNIALGFKIPQIAGLFFFFLFEDITSSFVHDKSMETQSRRVCYPEV